MTSPSGTNGPAQGSPAGDSTVGWQADRIAQRREAENMARSLALKVVEVIGGVRNIEQLTRVVTDDVYNHVRIRLSIAARARAITGTVTLRPSLWTNRVNHFSTAQDDNDAGYHAVVVVHSKRRAHAIMVRLERQSGRGAQGARETFWQATDLAIM